jgi:hypothetical protein
VKENEASERISVPLRNVVTRGGSRNSRLRVCEHTRGGGERRHPTLNNHPISRRLFPYHPLHADTMTLLQQLHIIATPTLTIGLYILLHCHCNERSRCSNEPSGRI